MKYKGFSHNLAEEDYTFLSGFLKAREIRFLKPADYTTMSRMMTLQELFDFLPKFNYRIHGHELDPVVFETYLWKPFEEEVTNLAHLEPEIFLHPYLESLQKLLFWKSDELVFSTFITLSKQGTELTRAILRLVADRFNFFEKLRAMHDQSADWLYQPEGNLSKETINQLFDSCFLSIELGTSYDAWKPFIEKESPVEKFDFNFTTRLDSFWKLALFKSYQESYYKIYGLDYCISYFLKWILEIEAITKVYFTLRFGLHFDLREELYLHVR